MYGGTMLFKVNQTRFFGLMVTLVFNTAVGSEYFSVAKNENSIQFEHHNGDSGDFYYPEIVGAGAAMLDYDNDGDLDVYMVQSGKFTDNNKTDRLFKNLLIETKQLSFVDVTESMQLKNNHYGIGVVTADVNQDGWLDMYLTNLHENQLLINQKGQGFKAMALEDTAKWSSSASFCDINNDGFKDLYVSNYVDWSEKNNPKCFNGSSKRDYCGPNSFAGAKDVFYVNVNGQKLVDKTAEYFGDMPGMPGLNAVCTDVNNDGWYDFIVANDGKANLLWLNQKGQSFKEAGLFSGIAVNAEGVAEASMGMAVADYDLDGDEDVFFTHLMNESNTLYKNNGKGFFQDVTNRSKLSRESFAYTGWATGFIHVNNDIYPDLVVFNGAVADASDKNTAMTSLAQANQLFLNGPNAQFKTVTGQKWLMHEAVSRGAAFGDIDNDGDVDIMVNNNHGKAELLLNNLNPKHWLGLEFKQQEPANLMVELVHSSKNTRIHLRTDGAYASAHDDRLLLNEAQVAHFDRIKVTKKGKVILDQPLERQNKYISVELK